MLQNDLATRIVDLREKNNINQTELAKKLGLEKSVMSKIENGTRKVSTHELAKIADLFGVTTDYLLGRPENEKTASDQKPLTENQKLVAYSIDPDISDEERKAIIEMVQAAKRFRRRI